MKKLLYILPVLVLLAAGCRSTFRPTNQQLPAVNNNQQPNQNVTTSFSGQSAPNGWLVYQNTQYGYTIFYPKGSLVKSFDDENNNIYITNQGNTPEIRICTESNNRNLTARQVATAWHDSAVAMQNITDSSKNNNTPLSNRLPTEALPSFPPTYCGAFGGKLIGKTTINGQEGYNMNVVFGNNKLICTYLANVNAVLAICRPREISPEQLKWDESIIATLRLSSTPTRTVPQALLNLTAPTSTYPLNQPGFFRPTSSPDRICYQETDKQKLAAYAQAVEKYFFQDVSIYPNATIDIFSGNDKPGVIFDTTYVLTFGGSFRTPNSVEKVTAFYQQDLQQQGWAVTHFAPVAKEKYIDSLYSSITAMKGNKTISIGISTACDGNTAIDVDGMVAKN